MYRRAVRYFPDDAEISRSAPSRRPCRPQPHARSSGIFPRLANAEQVGRHHERRDSNARGRRGRC
jgi:hypothetical protein